MGDTVTPHSSALQVLMLSREENGDGRRAGVDGLGWLDGRMVSPGGLGIWLLSLLRLP